MSKHYYDPVELSASMRTAVNQLKQRARKHGVDLDDQQAVTLALWYFRFVETGRDDTDAFDRASIIAQLDPADLDDIENDIKSNL